MFRDGGEEKRERKNKRGAAPPGNQRGCSGDFSICVFANATTGRRCCTPFRSVVRNTSVCIPVSAAASAPIRKKFVVIQSKINRAAGSGGLIGLEI